MAFMKIDKEEFESVINFDMEKESNKLEIKSLKEFDYENSFVIPQDKNHGLD